MRDGPPPIYRMQRCRNCPRYCKPCLTVEEAENVQIVRAEAHERGEAWKADSVCDACHKKSNRRQNELTAEKAGHGKQNKRAQRIQELLNALEMCEQAGVTLSDTELSKIQAAMADLGIG